MRFLNLQEIPKEQRKEMSFIEIAQYIFAEKKEPISFKDLVDEIAQFLELGEEETKTRMLQFYTDLNIDGRFITLGENRWGLREWYPSDKIDEEIITPVKPKKKKKKKRDEEDDELLEDFDDEDLDYDLDDDLEDDFDEEDDEDEEEDESLEALREEEEEEFDEDDELIDEDDYEIVDDEEEDIDLDEEDEEEEEEDEE